MLESWPITCKLKHRLVRDLAGDVMELDMPNANMLAELVTKSSSAIHHEPSPCALIEMPRGQTEKDASRCQGSLIGNMALGELKAPGRLRFEN